MVKLRWRKETRSVYLRSLLLKTWGQHDVAARSSGLKVALHTQRLKQLVALYSTFGCFQTHCLDLQYKTITLFSTPHDPQRCTHITPAKYSLPSHTYPAYHKITNSFDQQTTPGIRSLGLFVVVFLFHRDATLPLDIYNFKIRMSIDFFLLPSKKRTFTQDIQHHVVFTRYFSPSPHTHPRAHAHSNCHICFCLKAFH